MFARSSGLVLSCVLFVVIACGDGDDGRTGIPNAGGVSTLVGGAASTHPDVGAERGPCYGNGTCNTGLICASNVCVQLGRGSGGIGNTPETGGTTGSGGAAIDSGGRTAGGGTNSGITGSGGAAIDSGGRTAGGATDSASGGNVATGGISYSGSSGGVGPGASTSGGNSGIGGNDSGAGAGGTSIGGLSSASGGADAAMDTSVQDDSTLPAGYAPASDETPTNPGGPGSCAGSNTLLALNVPWFPQVPPGAWTTTMNCGPTSYLMIDAYYRSTIPTSSSIVAADDWMASNISDWNKNGYNGDAKGTTTAQVAELARAYGTYPYAAKFTGATCDDLRGELSAGRPVILSVDTQTTNNYPSTTMKPSSHGHFVVLVGMDNQYVYILDPGRSAALNGCGDSCAGRRYTLDSFNTIWSEHGRSGTFVRKQSSTGCSCGNGLCEPQTPCNEDCLSCDTDCSCSTPPDQCHVTVGSCTGGTCIYALRSPGSTCNDNDLCTTADQCNASGVCAGTSITCVAPPDQCHSAAGACIGGVCTYPLKSPGSTCNDGDACTYDDTCSNGTCSGTAITCNSDTCNTRTCNGTGSCAVTPKPASTGCDDGNAATCGDHCDGYGACVGGSGATNYYPDADGNGFGSPVGGMSSCGPTVGYVSNNTDCDDGDSHSHPGATEICDLKDNDCVAGGADPSCGVFVKRYHDCKSAHWSSNVENVGPYCAPWSPASTGCSLDGCSLNSCSNTSCWSIDSGPGTGFNVYTKQEGTLADLVHLYHCSKSGTTQNRYTTGACPSGFVQGSPYDLGLIATTSKGPPGVTPAALYECQWKLNGNVDDWFLTTSSTCEGVSYLARLQLGYVWP